MINREIIKRYMMLFMGIVFSAFGVALVTKAMLGTSPIAAIPYSLSLVLPMMSMGEWVVVFNVLLVAVQPLLLRGKTSLRDLAGQLAVTFIFGYFIDMFMYLLAGFAPQLYAIQIMSILAGCGFLALGAHCELTAGLVMLSRDAFVKAVSLFTGKSYGTVRVMSDMGMTIGGAAICMVFLNDLVGVREGTLIAACLVGNMLHIFNRNFSLEGFFQTDGVEAREYNLAE